jgi:hypothetical protein
MRRIAAISALLFAVGFMAFRVTAQPGPFDAGTRPPVDDPFTVREPAPRLEGTLRGPLDAQGETRADENPFAAALPQAASPIAPFVDAEARVSAMITEFGNSLNSALRDKVINEEQANRMLKELEVSLTVKRVRLDLLRTTMLLDKLQKDAEGVPGSEEINRLRQHLMSLQESGGAIVKPGPPPPGTYGEPTPAPAEK